MLVNKVWGSFGAKPNAQERWLNKIAAKGYRLVEVTPFHCEFEPGGEEKYEYFVKNLNSQPLSQRQAYKASLRGQGFQIFEVDEKKAHPLQARKKAFLARRKGRPETEPEGELLILEWEKGSPAPQVHTNAYYLLELCVNARNVVLCLSLIGLAFLLVSFVPDRYHGAIDIQTFRIGCGCTALVGGAVGWFCAAKVRGFRRMDHS